METNPLSPQYQTKVQALSLVQATKTFVKTAFPIFLQQYLRFVSDFLNIIIVAYIDNPIMLGGFGLGMAFYVTSSMAAFMGFNSGIATFVPQLLGMGKVKETGTYLNSGRIINCIICVPLMAILGFSNQILVALNQDPEVSYYASQFLKGLIPGLPFITLAILHTFYLNSFHIQTPGFVAAISSLVVQVACSLLFVFVFEWGLFGCGLAVSFANMTQSLIMMLSLLYYEESRKAQYWPSFSRLQWLNMKEYLMIGVPSLIITALEIGGIEIMQPLSGLISAEGSSTQSIAMNVFSAIFTVQISISITTSIFVGRSIGNGNVQQGRQFTKASMIVISVLSMIAILIIASLRNNIVALYTSDEDIQDKAIDALVFLCIALLPDSLIFSQLGAFRGLNRQKAAALIAIATCAFISIPLGCTFAFVMGMEVSGFWLGYAIRSIVAVLIFWVILWFRLDWHQIVKETQEREEKQRLQRLLEMDESRLIQLKHRMYASKYHSSTQNIHITMEQSPTKSERDYNKVAPITCNSFKLEN